MKLSEYNGSHVLLNGEIEYVECLHEMLDEDELDEEAAKTALAEALNAWAAKHLTGTVLVETRTRIDISELSEVKP